MTFLTLALRPCSRPWSQPRWLQWKRTSKPPRQRRGTNRTMCFSTGPTDPSKSLVKNLLGAARRTIWKDEWQAANTGRTTWDFFPTVSSAANVKKIAIRYQLYQLLTGHCKLNSFLHWIKRSPPFNCTSSNSIEDVEHFLFSCPRFSLTHGLQKIGRVRIGCLTTNPSRNIMAELLKP